MRFGHSIALLLASLLSSGCASMEETYVPRTIGSIPQDLEQERLVVEIDSAADFVRRGDPVRFSVRLTNHGSESLWIPANPHLLFVWTYPNGRRDNFLQDPPQPAFYDQNSAVELSPGQEMTRTMEIKTHHFDFDGVTEFRAVLQVAANTNPNLQPFWAGRTVSNGYGVMVTSDNRAAQLAERGHPSDRNKS